MTNLLAILIGAVVVNQLVLARHPAIWPPGVEASRIGMPVGISFITTIALALAVGITWLIDAWLLQPVDLRELRLLALVLAILVAEPLATLLAALGGATRQQNLTGYRALVTINCVMLGVAQLVTREPATLISALGWAAATGIGFAGIMALFTRLRERLDDADVPAPLRGAAITLLTAGLMSLAFSGIATVARG